MFDTIERARLKDLHVCFDEKSSLKAIIAIHNTRLGPALGGCRCLQYSSDQAAFADAVSLARGMSYKAALAGLQQGGGKSVILLPRQPIDRGPLFKAFGKFVDSLGGRYITAVDSGTELADLDVVAAHTSHVVGTGADGFDPSPMTARSVLIGIRASARARLNRDSLAGLTIAIQGVGHVGALLAELLDKEGVNLLLSDTNLERAQTLATKLGAKLVSVTDIYDAQCDVFAPCALGGVLNENTIPRLRCDVVAGAANTQLATPADGERLMKRNILYAPDYLINAGGLIRLSLVKSGQADKIDQRIESIADVLATIYKRYKTEKIPTNLIADRMAEELIFG